MKEITCTELGSSISDGSVKDPTTILLTSRPPTPVVEEGVAVSLSDGLCDEGGGLTTTCTTLPWTSERQLIVMSLSSV